MFKFFNRNTFVTYIALPILLIVLRLRLILHPQQILTGADADLYTPLWRACFGSFVEGSVMSVTLALILTMLSAYIVNSIFNRFHFSDHQSSIAGLYFILLSSGFVISYGLHPVQLFTFFFLEAILSIMYGAGTRAQMLACYNGAFLIAVGWLMWGKGAWFVPYFFIAQIILREGNLRSILASLLGLATPLAIAATWYFCDDSIHETCNLFWRNTIAPVAFYRTGLYTRTYLVLYALLIVAGLISAMQDMPKQKINESRNTRVIIWMVFVTASYIALPHFSFEMLEMVAIGGCILVAAFLQRMRSNAWQEGITLTLFVLTIYIQWKMKYL